MLGLLSPASSGDSHTIGCEPVVQAGKEVPQRTSHRIDDKRSYGKPGNESNPVRRKQCEIVDSKSSPSTFALQPHDCGDIQASGVNISGVYGIYLGGIGYPFNVYCDMETDGGGWTVFQRRMDGSVDFFRTWMEYKNGFGSVSSEHWLGNEKIHLLSKQKSYDLRVDLEAFNGDTRVAYFRRFELANETGNYRLTLGKSYRSNAGNSLKAHSGLRFSTMDRDHSSFGLKCPTKFRSGWWFHSCFRCNLNGVYYLNATFGHDNYEGLIWPTWLGTRYSLKGTEMKLRPMPDQ